MSYVGITIGDPSGIGPEITLKVVASSKQYMNSTVIFGSKSVIDYYAKVIKLEQSIHYINNISEFRPETINVYNVFDFEFSELLVGVENPISGDAAFQYLETAISLSMKNEIGPIVTAPLNKAALHAGGHKYDGHTEIFATLTNTKKYTMMLYSEKLKVVHVSTHVSLRNACDAVTKNRVEECIELAHNALVSLGYKNPRIAVAGLNPHSGEGGLFGFEEINEVEPAVAHKISEGYNVEGPVPPDTVFLKAVNGQFDLVVALYHDQGHIPMKLLAFDEGVNVTLGLPIIRTSVDHGTAFDIAGKGIASITSMEEAIKLAVRFSED